MKELDEKGFVFLDDNTVPFRCSIWGNRAWLFRWQHDHWVSFRPVNQSDIWTFPHNLTEVQQQLYFDRHDKWLKETMPSSILTTDEDTDEPKV